MLIQTNISILKYRMVQEIMLDTIKISFNLNTESTKKALSIINNVIKALVKKSANASIKGNCYN